MSKFEIKLTLDTSRPDQINLLNKLLNALSSEESKTTVTDSEDSDEVKEEEEEPKKRSRKTKIEKPEGVKEEVKPEETEEEGSTEEDSSDNSPTLDELKLLLSKKVNGDNRSDIRAKLNELGAQNVTGLDPSHYSEFYGYLNSLTNE